MYKVILTRELGRLAKWLRIVGFDAEYCRHENIPSLIIRALRENRKILTRHKEIGDMKVIHVHADDVRTQLKEVLTAFEFRPDERLLFRRCVVCNRGLERAGRDEVKGRVPEYVYSTHKEFFRCPHCGRTYWKGLHWEQVLAFLKEKQGDVQVS